ncbi:MAG: aconitate hydratase [Solirubrobacteraceae bacterium]|nr:aconitate hydratase [Solirubrobacteraceae bacterium]
MTSPHPDSFGAKDTLDVGGRPYEIFRLDALQSRYDVARLPYSLKVLLENLLRTEGNGSVTKEQIEALATWNAKADPSDEIAFTPARVVLQDFTGVPAVVDLAAMRDAMSDLGGDPSKIEPLVPAELVIDHSVQVDAFGTPQAFAHNAQKEFERNEERYQFLRWGQNAFDAFKVVPPDTGIVHQVNLEYLSRGVFVNEAGDVAQAYPDTLVGTDSHTTMVNGLGVLGWGVGGIEAEAAMLGQPIPMLIPNVVGFRLKGELPEGATATDLVLTVTELLRQTGVVGKFVEFFGEGVTRLPLADRATIGNMSPEFGSTAAIFPIDAETLRYMAFTGRPKDQLELIEAYAKAQGLWHDPEQEPTFSQVVELDLGDVVPSIAGPKRPQDRVSLSAAKEEFRGSLGELLGDTGCGTPYDKALANTFPASDPPKTTPGADDGCEPHAPTAGEHERGTAVMESETVAHVTMDGQTFPLDHGHVVIAAITSCTNTSNPSVMVAAGLVARKAAALGLNRKPWVKTSLAPGSMVVTDYLERAGLNVDLDALGFNLVGYGCTTCIGNSGPLPTEISQAINDNDLAVTSVLSGNRNFEGRISPDVKMNYLASPPLVVAYALAGTMDFDFETDALGTGSDGRDVYLKDIWPTAKEIAQTVEECLQADMFRKSYAQVFDGDANWQGLEVPSGDTYAWDPASTYVQKAPYFDGMPATPDPVTDIAGARVMAKLGDSVTTDHISPAGAIKRDAPAGQYLEGRGVKPADFNSYGSRRGSHDVMIRGTFANIRLRNQLAPGTEGGFTRYLLADGQLPEGEVTTIYEACEAYQKAGVPLVVLGGKEYGSGSSRDWAAKGTNLLGVRAVITESFERIHRSNLVGMGVLPLQFPDGESADSLGLTGEETFTISGLADALNAGELPKTVTVTADDKTFEARVRIDTPKEAEYYRHGGILQYVLRQLVAAG